MFHGSADAAMCVTQPSAPISILDSPQDLPLATVKRAHQEQAQESGLKTVVTGSTFLHCGCSHHGTTVNAPTKGGDCGCWAGGVSGGSLRRRQRRRCRSVRVTRRLVVIGCSALLDIAVSSSCKGWRGCIIISPASPPTCTLMTRSFVFWIWSISHTTY